MNYEQLKHNGELPLIGVNQFIHPNPKLQADQMPLSRSTKKEKNDQLNSLNRFHQFHQLDSKEALKKLKQTCLKNENILLSSSKLYSEHVYSPKL